MKVLMYQGQGGVLTWQVCDVCGKGKMSGNAVSHSNRHNKEHGLQI